MSLTPTAQRNLSNSLAGKNPEQALTVARAIEEPWFRCQALSQVARYWPDDGFQPLLREATEAAERQENWYKRVSVSAWPARAYLERGSRSPARNLLEEYTSGASNIENMGGRSEALLMLFQAARPFDSALWEPVFWGLITATEPSISWRQLRNVRQAASMVAAENPGLVRTAINRLSNDKFVLAVTRDLENHRFAEPRPFFWLG